MNSNKILAILGLLLLLILAIGSVSASDMDSEIVGDSADIDLISEEAIIDETDKSNIAEEENTEMTIADAVEDDLSDSDSIDSIQGTEKDSVGVKNDLGANNLASTIKFKESSYSTYFNNNGNIISGKLKSGDILDFSGKFADKMFIINIPLIVTSTDRTAQLTNCGFKFINGSSGSSISNLKMDNTIANRPLIAASDVNDMEIYNNNLFATGRSSHPMSFSRVNRLHIYKNTLQSSGYVEGWGQPSAMVLNNAGSCNITQNTVITNDSNGIYFSGYGANTGMGAGEDAASYSNYIVNNTVYSIRPLPSSFVYAIQVMSSYNYIINNTVYNAYRGISTTGSNNQIIGNTISRIHGAYYSQTTEEQGGEAAIISGSNSIVKENIISDCLFNQDIKGTAINVNGNSIVTDNIIKNCTGNGLVLKGGNVTFTNNKLNVSGYGVFAEGNMADVDMEMNVIDSSNQHAIHLARTSRYDYPHDFIIQNNTLYSTADEAIYMDDVCTNILRSNNIIIGESGSPIVDNDTTHIINEKNFYNYFSLTGSFNNRVKENDTVIFVGDFSSKGKLNINKNVIIQGVNAIFEDTTFLISEVDDLIFENINITNPNKKLSDRMWGIQISGSNNVTVRNCSISIYDPNSAFAIYVLDSNACKILNNSLEAVGDYFTAALFSFNSTNLLVDGNTLNTIGTGETYLCNNQSCLNILVKGVTICPDGTVICPDGTTYTPEEYTVCADGTIICPDGTTICTDGTTICADGTQICADGTIICVDGTQICTDGTIICADGTSYNPGEYTVCADGTIICPDGKVICVDGTIYSSAECETLANGTIVCPDGTQICPDGSVICTDGSTICPDGRTICADGTIICADGYRICTDGRVICPDGTTVASDDYTLLEDGTIVLSDNTKIFANGTVVCADGTVICPDGAGSNGVLDGVIPGTHMISGLFRAYGALFVHSSNNNFTNNVVNVGSALSPFYKLNESCNTIAGVFIHYGGFNNTISNNNITLNSNDPIIYAIGIVGASSNSTAVGSKNNSFISNRVSVKSLYHGVGIYLGYKAINSTFANNNFIINAINAYEIVNRTLVENDENVLEGNTFEIITPHYTALTVSSVSYKWNNGNKYVSITLKDLNGTLIPNQQITFTLDGKNYTGTTNAKGVATVKVTLNKVGAFDIVAYFDGSENFIPSTNKGKITLTKDSTSLASAGKTYAVTASAKTIAVTLKDGSGKAIANRKITATVNGKTFSATTNAKGVATIKLTLTAVKTYKVALKFAGDSYYTGSTKSIKVKVTKTKTKLTVPKKTYKKSKKVKKLTATLKDNAGKKIKGKKLTFIVNKKKYTAKTNKKGVATVKVKLSKKKTFKFTVKFAGDKTYVAVKKTGKLVIK